MIRLVTVLCLVFWLPLAGAAERLSPRLSQRLYLIMDRAAENPEASLEDLRQLLESRSMSPAEKGYIAYERAGLLIQQGQSDTALKEMQAALATDSITFIPRLRRLYAQLLLMSDHPQLALEQLETWADEVVDPLPTELVLMGYTYLQLDRFDEAAVTLERTLAIADHPQPQWSELLAYAYTQSGHTDKAIRLLETLIDEQPGQSRWWRQLANLYLLVENTPKGAAGLVVASHIEDMSYEEARRLAHLFASLGMPADAATLLSKALERYRDLNSGIIDFEDQMLLGEMWMLARELELAVDAFAVAADMEKTSEPHLKTAQLYLQWERYEEAREALLQAASSAGESTPSQISYLLAITEINLGNLQSASDLLMRLGDDPEYAARVRRLDAYIVNLLDNPSSF